MTQGSPIQVLMDTLPQIGKVEWIGVRPARGIPMIELDSVQIDCDTALAGDRFGGAAGSPRQVTLIMMEHIAVIAACLGKESIMPALLRRNIVVSGMNLLALKDRRFRIGEALLDFTGACHPCSKMERLLGPGGYNAMRGHGGITASVVTSGMVRLGDAVTKTKD